MVVEGKRRLEGSIWKHKILSSQSNWKEKNKTHIVVQMNDGQEVLRDDKLFKHVTKFYKILLGQSTLTR
jgi:hypothetical protein